MRIMTNNSSLWWSRTLNNMRPQILPESTTTNRRALVGSLFGGTFLLMALSPYDVTGDHTV